MFMKKSILTLVLLTISICVYSQQDLKEKYKDYKACTDCADQWNTYNASLGNSITLFKTSSSPRSNQVGREAKRQFGTVVTTVVGIFISAIAISVYAKANKAAYGVQ